MAEQGGFNPGQFMWVPRPPGFPSSAADYAQLWASLLPFRAYVLLINISIIRWERELVKMFNSVIPTELETICKLFSSKFLRDPLAPFPRDPATYIYALNSTISGVLQ